MDRSLADKIVELGEERLQKLMQELMQNPRILKAISDAIKTGTQARENITGVLKGITQMLNLPGLEDVQRMENTLAELGEKLADGESRLDKLTAALAAKADREATVHKPATSKPATKKPSGKPAAKASTAKKTVKKTAPKVAAKKKPATRKPAPKKPATKKPVGKKTTAKKGAGKKAPAKTPAKKSAGK